jgi:CRISPR-associated exonuclease Cas4
MYRIVRSFTPHSSGGDYIELFLFACVLIISSAALLMYALRLRSSVKQEKKHYGIPEGLLLYSDLNTPAQPLFSRRLRLAGKPDYILQKDSHYIPVEVKTGRQPHPQQSHILQLAAYCQLIEDTAGSFVPEGILVYNNVPYTIPFDPKLRFELETVMRTMRLSLHNGVEGRNHSQPGRCWHCSMQQYCTDALP